MEVILEYKQRVKKQVGFLFLGDLRCSFTLQEDKQRILELREYAKEARMGVAAMGVRRVEKIEGDLLRKMPNKFKVIWSETLNCLLPLLTI